MIKRFAAMAIFVALIAGLVPVIGDSSAGAAGPIAAGRVHKTFHPNKGKIFVLIIGSDARHGNPNLRADAIHIAGINTRTMRGGILNFPRDSWVNIPGHGSAKINEALNRGGPQLLARTLEHETGIRIDYWVMVGFQGFERIIHRLGPVQMRLARPIYDAGGSGARLRAGKQRLRPAEALAFVRTRKAFSAGDIARTTNQGRFLLALLRKLRSNVETKPATLLKWMAVARENTRLNLSPEDMFRLAILTSQVSPRRVGNVTVPVSLGSVGAASVVFISQAANRLYRRFERKGSL
jgi:polyisoprenyl-teichoic acid--peptidoglycan teichoic acid transferase